MKNIFSMLILFLLALVSVTEAQEKYVRDTPNFVCNDPKIAQLAEKYRKELSTYWQGTPFRLDWTNPVPITVLRNQNVGGVTNMNFSEGEVAFINMMVSGPDEAYLHAVLKHEVDHTVRAAIIRRPQYRWIDEGAAQHIEPPRNKLEILTQARQYYSTQPFQYTLLYSDQYPSDANSVGMLYSGSMIFVDYMIAEKGAAYFIEFSKSQANIDKRVKAYYGVSVKELVDDAFEWQVKRGWDTPFDPFVIVGEEIANVVEAGPIAEIWSTSWCGPCIKLKADYEASGTFRKNLHGIVTPKFFDLDKYRKEAKDRGITQVPTTILYSRVSGKEIGRFSGYTNKEAFLKQISDTLSKAIGGSPVSSTEEVAPTPPEDPEASQNDSTGLTEPISESVVSVVPEIEENEPELELKGVDLILMLPKSYDTVPVGVWNALIDKAVNLTGTEVIDVQVVSELYSPVSYAKISEASGMSVIDTVTLFPLIPETNQGFVKGLLIQRLEKVLQKKAQDLLVKPVFERINQLSYIEMLAAMDDSETEEVPEDAPTLYEAFVSFVEPYLPFGLAAVISERVFAFLSFFGLNLREKHLAAKETKLDTEKKEEPSKES